MTGRTCVGDLRLASLDVGFDLRLARQFVALPANFSSVGLNDSAGNTWLVEGTRAEMIREIEKAGYRVKRET
jgi:hypothetical protein